MATTMRTTQVTAEAIVAPTAAKVRATQAVAEALVQRAVAGTSVRVTDVFVEAIVQRTQSATLSRTTQAYVEVIHRNWCGETPVIPATPAVSGCASLPPPDDSVAYGG